MSFELITQKIVQRFAAQTLKFTDASLLPEALVDCQKVYPGDQVDTSAFKKPWVRVNVAFNETHHAGTGTGPLYQWVGLIVFDVFTPANTGVRNALEIARQLQQTWRNKTFDCIQTLRFDNPFVDGWTYMGFSDNWEMHQYKAPWRYFEIT